MGETLEDTTGSTLPWYCKRLKTYAGRTKALPIDQHELMALIAPRGVYVSSADEDLWADPRGEYSSLVEAAPVFQLLGKESITNPAMPPLNSPRVKGVTGYHIRTGVHDVTNQDWDWFLDFADALLK